MKLSPSTIAANLSAAAAAEAEAAANSNLPSINVTSYANTTVSTTTGAALSSINSTSASIMMSSVNPSQGKAVPKDTQVIAAILKEMGINEYEPRVLPQLVEFAYRYASHVLEDAQLFSSYAKKKVIDTDDVSIAVQMQVDRSFVGPPSRDVLLEIARNKNAQPLPPIKSHNGLRLPADRYSLVASNLRLVSANKPQQQTGQNNNNKVVPRSGTSLLSKFSTQLNSNNSTNKPSTPGTDTIGMKRRLDET